MRYLYGEETFEDVFVRNRTATKGLVVLLPVTRIGEQNIQNWEKILQVINTSEVMALVVLDKTPLAEASAFFYKHSDSLKSDIYLVRRFPDEAIYDSQSVVNIDQNLWILQLHDDDQWSGILAFPNEPSGMQLFSPNFTLVGKRGSKILNWESSPPARINFTALPADVWNRFTLFIRSQGGHAAGSVDSTLNLMSRLICECKTMYTFDYRYNSRHWENQKQARKNLEKLALQDGWENLASEEIQLLNRRIDAFCALIFFGDLLPNKFDSTRLALLRDFELSLKKRLHLRARILGYSAIKILDALKFSMGADADEAKQRHLISNRIEVDKLTLSSTKIRTQQDILEIVRLIQASGNFPLLRERFVFWESTFQ